MTINHLSTAFAVIAGAVMLSGCCGPQSVQRFGSVIGLKAEKLAEYKELHANTWPEILKSIEEANIHNYSIYLTQFDDGNHYLFSYFEYTGSDLESDFKALADGPRTKEWWALTDPMQQPLTTRKEGDHWKSMEEVFHAE